MVYTCAYFPDARRHARRGAGGQDGPRLPQAAAAARRDGGRGRLRLGRAWRCYMARHYGVHGARRTTSRASRSPMPAQRARAEGLDGRVEFIEDDYRNITGRYDAFVSVGMLEHVGRDHYRELGAVIDRCLTPDGRGLIHSIGRDQPAPLNAWIERRIFPGAYPPTLREMMDDLRAVRASRCSTSRTCGCTTRRRSSTGCALRGGRRARWPRCSTTRSCGRGGCTSPARSPAFTTGIAAAVPGAVRPPAATTCRGRARTCTAAERARPARRAVGDRARGDRSSTWRPGATSRIGGGLAELERRMAPAACRVPCVLDQATFPRAKAVRRLDHAGGGARPRARPGRLSAPVPDLRRACSVHLEGAAAAAALRRSTRSAASSSTPGCSSAPAREVRQHDVRQSSASRATAYRDRRPVPLPLSGRRRRDPLPGLPRPVPSRRAAPTRAAGGHAGTRVSRTHWQRSGLPSLVLRRTACPATPGTCPSATAISTSASAAWRSSCKRRDDVHRGATGSASIASSAGGSAARARGSSPSGLQLLPARRRSSPRRLGNAFVTGDAAGLATRDLCEGIGPAVRSGLRAAARDPRWRGSTRLEDVHGGLSLGGGRASALARSPLQAGARASGRATGRWPCGRPHRLTGSISRGSAPRAAPPRRSRRRPRRCRCASARCARGRRRRDRGPPAGLRPRSRRRCAAAPSCRSTSRFAGHHVPVRRVGRDHLHRQRRRVLVAPGVEARRLRDVERVDHRAVGHRPPADREVDRHGLGQRVEPVTLAREDAHLGAQPCPRRGGEVAATQRRRRWRGARLASCASGAGVELAAAAGSAATSTPGSQCCGRESRYCQPETSRAAAISHGTKRADIRRPAAAHPAARAAARSTAPAPGTEFAVLAEQRRAGLVHAAFAAEVPADRDRRLVDAQAALHLRGRARRAASRARRCAVAK